MQTIRVDGEVMRELQRRAYEVGLVFGSPNQVLRLILELDDSGDQTKEPRSVMAEPTAKSASLQMNKGRRRVRVTGRSLLRSHLDLPQDMRAYSDREGLFYEWPIDWPAILFDSTGYIIYETEDHMVRHEQYLYLYRDTMKINAQAHGGISKLPGYVLCSHSHY